MSWSRDGSRERDLVLRPASSFSSESRQRVPMWDSSDPDRAPPPLPLNPGLQQSPTKPNTGATVAAAAEALLSRARESMSNSYQQNSPPKQTAEQSLLKGTMHKRMQSFQQSSGGVKDLSLYRENVRSGAPSPEKAPPPAFDLSRAQERSPSRPLEPITPVPRHSDSSRESTIRTIRPDPRPILGEPSPKSATMRALERGSSSDTPTLDSQRDASSSSLVKATPSFDAISSQISGLTSIATNLQREMSQLSKRSKDNASDLVGLKEATNARDEDIRKSLRELIGKLNSVPLDLNFDESPRGLFLENQTPSKAPRSLNPSLISSIERELSAGSDGSAAIALLEKILREMGTKDGQERLLASFSEIKNRNGGSSDSSVSRKLDDLLAAVRHSSQSRALIKVPEVRTASAPMSQSTPNSKHVSFESPRSGPKDASPMVGAGVVALATGDVVNEDMMKLLKRMKDSISESGCFTAEIKTLVRDLRGEVLGMGREIAKKLEQTQSNRPANTTRGVDGPAQDEIAAIVEKGLADLHTHMNAVIETHRRQSSSIQRKPEELDQIAHVVQNAIKSSSPTREITIDTGSGIQREDILDAVKEAWEAYKPEMHSQNVGLGRDEIMQCLQEGFKQHRSAHSGADSIGPVYDDVLAAVRHGLESFKVPRVQFEAAITREEILETIRESLEDATLSSGHSSSKDGMSHGKIMEAIRDGVALQSDSNDNTRFLNDVRDLFSEMKLEMLDSQGLPSAEGLSTLKTDLQALKVSLDNHAIRADPASNHELLETIRNNLDGLRSEIVAAVALIQPQPQTSSTELLDAMEREFEHLRASLKTTIRDNDAGSTLGREELLDAMREGVDGLKELGTGSDPSGLTEIKEELEHLRTVLAATLTKQGTANHDTEGVVEAVKECLDNFSFKAFKDSGRPESVISNTNELLDAFQDGVDSLKAEMQALKASVSQDRIQEILRKEMGTTKDDQTSKARPTSRGGGAVMLADQVSPDLALMFSKLETKFETLGKTAAAASTSPPPPAERDTGLHEKIDILMQKMNETASSTGSRASTGANNLGDLASKDDVEAIETLLRNTRAKLDEVLPDETNLDQMADLLRSTRDALDELAIKQESDVASKHDVIKLTAILMELSKAELSNAESRDLLKNALAEHGSLNVKTDISVLAGLLRALTDDLEAQHELTAQAFEARKTEHGGLADKIEEIRVQLEAEKSDLETKIEVQTETMAGLMTSMTTIGELLGVTHENGTFAEFYTTVQKEFEDLKARELLAKEQTERDQATLFEKYDAQKDLIVEDLGNKIDVRLDEILIKYDDAQLAAEARTAMVEERNVRQDEVMISVKSTAEDLKLLVDGLGQSVTASCDKMSEDSKVVFSSIEQLSNQILAKMDTTSIEAGREHLSTRGDVAKALSGLEALQNHNTEHHPKLVGMAAEILAALVAVREKQDAHETLLQERQQPDLSLPALPGVGSPRDVPTGESGFDDSKMHAKLDQIVSMASNSEHLAALDAIKQQVSDIAAEVKSMASGSNRAIAITDGSDADSEMVENLSSKRDLLTAEVDLLREEEKALQISKAKLQADLSSLESALQIRREEMQLMEQRAEMLERRIIDGVLDHSHALLMSSRPQSGLDKLNLKRVKKPVDIPLTPGKVRKNAAEPISAVSNAIGMAMKSRPKVLRAEARPASPADRRILSLSSAAGNRTPTSKLTPPISQKLDPFPSMKRSQSVNKKDSFDRKASWATTATFQMLDEDKENGMQNSIGDKPGMERDHSNSTSLRANLGVDSDASDFSGDEYEETYGEPAALPAGKPGRDLVVYTGPADSGIGSDLPTTAGSEKRFFEESVVSR